MIYIYGIIFVLIIIFIIYYYCISSTKNPEKIQEKNTKKNNYIDFDYKKIKNKEIPIDSLNPKLASDYYSVVYNEWIGNKFNTTIKFFKYLGINEELINKLINIRKLIDKNIIYAIKNKDGDYKMELHLYSKNVNDIGHNIDYKKFKKDIGIILNEFDKEYNDDLDKKLDENTTHIISFDLDIKNVLLNDKIILYFKENETKENVSYAFNLENSEFILNSKFNGIKDYDTLSEKLVEYKIDKELINELKEINEKPVIVLHNKNLTNNIDIYLLSNDADIFENFLKKYNYKNIVFDKEENKLLKFDIAINYNSAEKKIESTAFFDYF